MAWTASAIFRATTLDVWGNTTAMDLDADTIKCALFNNSITPDKDATSANSGFNAGQWANTNELTSSSAWPAGGVALTSRTWTASATGVVMLDATDTASGSGATISGAYGCQHYDDTLTTPVADQGICYNYFGGSASVTSGVLTVVYHANGIMRFTV